MNWRTLGDLGRIRGFTDTIHYVLPKLLLVVSAFDEGLIGVSGTASRPSQAAFRPGVVAGTTVLPMVTASEASGRLRKVLEEIRKRHGHPDVASYYRGIANWPPFLEAVWDTVRKTGSSSLLILMANPSGSSWLSYQPDERRTSRGGFRYSHQPLAHPQKT